MGTIIKEIKIPDENYSFISDDGEKGDVLKNLSKINIFVGENNSGKSRFLRNLISEKSIEFIPFSEDFNKLNNFVTNWNYEIHKFCEGFPELERIKKNYPEIIETLEFCKNIENKEFLFQGYDPCAMIYEIKEQIEYLGKYKISENYFSPKNFANNLMAIFLNCFRKYVSEEKSIEDIKLAYSFTKVYVPILRGLRPLNYGSDENAHGRGIFTKDIYQIRTKNDYFKFSDVDRPFKGEEFIIFTGSSTYDNIHKFLRRNHQTQEIIREFQEYLSENFFDNNNVKLTPAIDEYDNDNDVITVKIGDEKERPIYDLGDGIQSMIILTLPLFLYKNEKTDNILVFIEEPEHLLHPGLQRKLIDTFNDKQFKNYQFFITTHSNHFLDISLDYDDISIFTLKKELDDTVHDEKEPKFLIENISYGNTNALELLGVRNSSVFLSNCTIWIEGITDRYYIKKYLEIFQDYTREKAEDKDIPFMEFREDYHYSFVEYAGSNVTHWSFLEGLDDEERMDVRRLCSNAFLIADKDNESGKVDRKKILRENLGENFCLLTCREIENLLTEKTLLEVLKDFEYRNKDEMDKLNSDNFKRETYIDEPIGRFIKTVILKDLAKTRKYEANSGTLDSNIKLDFCKKAISHINDIDDLSDDAVGLCNCLYRFIAKENGYNDLCKKLDIPECNSDKGCQKVKNDDNTGEMD